MARTMMPTPPANLAPQMLEECCWVLRANVVDGRLPRAETKVITDQLDALRVKLEDLTTAPTTQL